MSRLVADLLFLSREEVAAIGPGVQVRLDVLAEEIVERLAPIAPDHEVRIEHAEPAVVLGDPDRLRQLVTNLIENAIRYSPGSGRVAVRVALPDQNCVRLEVADNGVGIPPEHLSRIFDRFYRVDPARSRATGGSGLGLAIVKHIAESHGGKVTAASEPGVGSTFTVMLPVEAPAAAGPGSGSSSATPASATPANSLPTTPAPASPTAPAAAPSGRAADSPPAGTPPIGDRPARHP